MKKPRIKFRTAREEEHAQLVRLAKTSQYTRDFSNRVMFSSERAYEKGWIRVAEVDGEIAGFSCVRHSIRWPETVLYFIVVAEHMRSKGLGEAMIHDIMRHSPHKKMRLNVMVDNVRAVAFYQRMGFTIAGTAIGAAAYSMVKEFA